MLNDGRDENGVFGGETSVRNLSSSRSLLYAASNNGESTERERPSAMKFILARIGFSSLPNFEFIGTAFENAVLLTMKIKELLTSEMLVTHLRTISIPSLEILELCSGCGGKIDPNEGIFRRLERKISHTIACSGSDQSGLSKEVKQVKATLECNKKKIEQLGASMINKVPNDTILMFQGPFRTMTKPVVAVKEQD